MKQLQNALTSEQERFRWILIASIINLEMDVSEFIPRVARLGLR
jgi:hypothetical protein